MRISSSAASRILRIASTLKLRVLTLPFDAELGRFDDEPVQRLLADKELIAARSTASVRRRMVISVE